jgi:hypothetical protein
MDTRAQSLQPKELHRLKIDDELPREAQRVVKFQQRPTDPTLEGRVIKGLKLLVLSGCDIWGPHEDAYDDYDILGRDVFEIGTSIRTGNVKFQESEMNQITFDASC